MAKHGDVWRSKCGFMELRCGDWREVLQDVEPDAVITDPPYGARTHSNHRTDDARDGKPRRELSYAPMSHDDVDEFCAHWSSVASGWFFSMTSHDLFPVYESALSSAGRYVFHPIPVMMPGMTCRLAGDGPSSWVVYGVAARPRIFPYAKWGTLPGGYYGKPGADHVGGKPYWLMCDLVRDYSREGDLVVDPCAGAGTTLRAAADKRRRSIGAEIDPETFETAVGIMERAGGQYGLFD